MKVLEKFQKHKSTIIITEKGLLTASSTATEIWYPFQPKCLKQHCLGRVC